MNTIVSLPKSGRRFPVASRCLSGSLLQLLLAGWLLAHAGSVSTLSAGLAANASADWHLLPVPDSWRSVPRGEQVPIDGYSWYRALVNIPESWKGTDLTVFMEALDDARSTWINGQTAGATGTFPPQFRSGLGERGQYTIPADQIRAGEWNTIAIRIYQSDPRPNFSVAPPILMNTETMEAMRLEGVWQYRPGDDVAWSQAGPSEFGIDSASEITNPEGLKRGLFQQIDLVDNIERYVSRRTGDTDPLSPAEAVKSFQTPDDLEVQLVLGDPQISQPLFMMWDERGRMWVLEYRQYPDPAGLTMLSRDTFLRTVYDKVPPPPPHHFKGQDRISIHEDTTGDGVYDRHSVFVDDLNIATSFAIGHGGVFVTNPPYLLFYPDQDGNDIPDGDPEVLLEGFGIEDSHSVINSLRFGPDGWLYGAQGSTVTAAVRRPGSTEPPIRTVGQQIWRYHPLTRTFEVFAEGGGNTFGCEFDSRGRVFSGHNGGDTRGFHYVQGGYYRKGFGKHGPLSNPFAFGFFENIKHHSVARFTHNFVIYEDSVLPSRYQGKLFGIEPLQGQVVLSEIQPWQSSFETYDLERVITTDDPWFRPVDIKCGPDGCIYVADMYEQRIDHSSHYAGRIDRTNGRIYRLKPVAPDAPADRRPVDYRSMTAEDLIMALGHPSKWHRQTALRLINDHADVSLIPKLLQQLHSSEGQLALDLLWALQASGGLSESAAGDLLRHPDEFVRTWTVRFLGDQQTVSDEMAVALMQTAVDEPSIEVRKQLASSARRLPPNCALPIINALLNYSDDTHDLHQPLLIWWAVEAQVGTAQAQHLLVTLLEDQAAWDRPLVSQYILERLMKRYAAAGNREDLLNAAVLLDAAPDHSHAEILLRGFEEAFQGRSLAGIPDQLAEAITGSGGGSLALRVRQGQSTAVQEAIRRVLDASAELNERNQLIEIFGQTAQADVLPLLLKLAEEERNQVLLSTTLTALMNFDDLLIAETVVQRFSDLPEEPRLAAESLLSSRPAWSLQFVSAVDQGAISLDQITDSAVRKMLLHQLPELHTLIETHWGSVSGASTAEMQAEVARVNEILQTGTGNPRQGKHLYMQNCGRCHLLFDEGGRIGPDLTPFARDNLERMLPSIVNPSLEIREGFENHLIITMDGRVLNGFLADRDTQVVILRGIDGQNVVVRQDDIEEMRVVPQSVMPEGALKALTDQQIRDLFAYLRSSQPVNY